MITYNEEELDFINQSLEKIVYRVTLPVAIRTILKILHKIYPNQDSDSLYDIILFKTNPSLAFPKSDIEKILFTKFDNTIRVEITLNFLSIFGAASPLPLHYSEKVLSDAQDAHILLDFLDMLNHRLKKLIYPIWKQQRYYIEYENDLKDHFSKYVLSILGLYPQSQDSETALNLHKLLPFSGILSMHQKSSITLLSLLRHYFSHDTIEIEEGIISKSILPEEQHAKLGDMNCQLGVNMCVGTFVLTRNLKFRVHFKYIRWDELEAFSFYGGKRKELSELMQLIQKTPLSYDIAITIAKNEIKPSYLGGENGCCLGVNGWIGCIEEDQHIVVA